MPPVLWLVGVGDRCVVLLVRIQCDACFTPEAVVSDWVRFSANSCQDNIENDNIAS